MKDIEFYISDLDSTVIKGTNKFGDISEIYNKSFQLKDSLELSQQLYIMSTMLELFFA